MTTPLVTGESIVLGGGCFWCVEAMLERLAGVTRVESGYAGGTVENPTYQQVCTGTTGHAEVVRVSYDPAQISLADLLRIFFTVHDPTTLNRQGPDEGTQYRSVIFCADEAQKTTALQIKAEIEAEKIWDAPLVTEIAPLSAFFPAEGYHQEYFRQNPQQSYCAFVIAPKVAKFRAKFKARLRPDAQ